MSERLCRAITAAVADCLIDLTEAEAWKAAPIGPAAGIGSSALGSRALARARLGKAPMMSLGQRAAGVRDALIDPAATVARRAATSPVVGPLLRGWTALEANRLAGPVIRGAQGFNDLNYMAGYVLPELRRSGTGLVLGLHDMAPATEQAVYGYHTVPYATPELQGQSHALAWNPENGWRRWEPGLKLPPPQTPGRQIHVRGDQSGHYAVPPSAYGW